MDILKFNEFNRSIDISSDFFESLYSKEDIVFNSLEYNVILKKYISDLSLNEILLTTFDSGINSVYKFISELLKNSNLNVELEVDNITLLTITALSISYLDERKLGLTSKEISEYDNDDSMKLDIKSLLEELKLRGIGNGIVKKIVSCLSTLFKLFKFILDKSNNNTILGFIDMLEYPKIFVAFMSAVVFVSNKFNLNINTLSSIYSSIELTTMSNIGNDIINTLSNVLSKELGIDDIKVNTTEVIIDNTNEIINEIINENEE